MGADDITLYAIRHLQCVTNTTPHLIGGRSNDSPLVEGAEEEGYRIAHVLSKEGIVPDIVFASPAVRALRTAEIVLETMQSDLKAEVHDDLQELDQGTWTGRLRTGVYTPEVLTEIERLDKDFKADGGESMNEVGARMFQWVESLSSLAATIKSAKSPLIIFAFTHSIAIRCLAARIEGWSRLKVLETPTPNGSVSKFIKQGKTWQVEYVGRTAEDKL